MEWVNLGLKFWPLLAVTAVLTVMGEFLGKRIFTRDRAYADYGKDWLGKAVKWLMWWGREALPLYPLGVGFAIGKSWPDPFSLGWDSRESQWAFALCGFASLGAWVILKSRAKKAGIVLELPGETDPPPAAGADDATNVLGQTPVGDKLDP